LNNHDNYKVKLTISFSSIGRLRGTNKVQRNFKVQTNVYTFQW